MFPLTREIIGHLFISTHPGDHCIQQGTTADSGLISVSIGFGSYHLSSFPGQAVEIPPGLHIRIVFPFLPFFFSFLDVVSAGSSGSMISAYFSL